MTTYTINATPLTGSTPLVVNCTASSNDGSPFVITWDFGDGSPRITGSNVSYTYEKQGTFTLTGAVTNGSSQSFTVTPVGPLVASFVADNTNLYVNGTVNFTDTSTGNPLQWQWNFGDGSPYSYVQNPTHTYSIPGVYAVNLQVDDTPPPIPYRYWRIEILSLRQPDGTARNLGALGIAGVQYSLKGINNPNVPMTSNNTPAPFSVTGTPAPSPETDHWHAYQDGLVYGEYYEGVFYSGDLAISMEIDFGTSVVADNIKIALTDANNYYPVNFDIQASHSGNFDGGDFVYKYYSSDHGPWPGNYQYLSFPLNTTN